MASSHQPGPAEVDVTRIVCGDPTRYGPGFDERPVDAIDSWSVELDEQPLTPGSYGVASVDGVPSAQRLGLRVWVMPTLLDRPARIVTLTARASDASPGSSEFEALRLDLVDGRAVASTSVAGTETQVLVDELALTRNRWYLLDVELDTEAGKLSVSLVTARSDSPGRDSVEAGRLSDMAFVELEAELDASAGDDRVRHGVRVAATSGALVGAAALAPVELWLGAGPGGERFDGRVARPILRSGNFSASWDLAANLAGRQVPARNPSCGPVVLHQLPTRAITGPAWDGSAHRWIDNPAHFDAVHFHHDDLYDAGWETTVTADAARRSAERYLRLRGARRRRRGPGAVFRPARRQAPRPPMWHCSCRRPPTWPTPTTGCCSRAPTSSPQRHAFDLSTRTSATIPNWDAATTRSTLIEAA